MIDELNKYNKYFVDIENIKTQLVEWNQFNVQRTVNSAVDSLFTKRDVQSEINKLKPLYQRKCNDFTGKTTSNKRKK